ncbi:MAG: alpha-glucosidase/alpha-galactosidase [Oscillospiraceae bacterium]|nr:alpha-glucosidase/alpha-galactosidase [Oscillospiraceae bacterium]
MKHLGNRVDDVKIAYIGGGSRGWAWGLMSDLAKTEDMSGTVYLYDIDYEAAQKNEVIGNRIKDLLDCKTAWGYKAVETIDEALCGADFVVISILPGTFDEMESDVHTPEKYGIYQSVGDTSGPGGIIRALRTIPMLEVIAKAVERNCPKAWVINYTNPMTVCMQGLYRAFPKIKAFGCCHEVFGTQKFLAAAAAEMLGIERPERSEIKVNVVGVNHFTWFTDAHYKNHDLFPLYKEFCEKHIDGVEDKADDNWMNNSFASAEKIKMNLFLRFGYIAAAGDRHLAEFCPGNWFLKDPETVKNWKFGLTTVKWRKDDLKKRLERSQRLYTGEEKFEIKETGEEGVRQMRALLGLEDMVTNVNIPNYGQTPNLPLGAVVETNARFSADSVQPVFSGDVPKEIYQLISRISAEQQLITDACAERDLDKAFNAFICDPLVTTIGWADAKKLFDEMVENTKAYLGEYLNK